MRAIHSIVCNPRLTLARPESRSFTPEGRSPVYDPSPTNMLSFIRKGVDVRAADISSRKCRDHSRCRVRGKRKGHDRCPATRGHHITIIAECRERATLQPKRRRNGKRESRGNDCCGRGRARALSRRKVGREETPRIDVTYVTIVFKLRCHQSLVYRRSKTGPGNDRDGFLAFARCYMTRVTAAAGTPGRFPCSSNAALTGVYVPALLSLPHDIDF